jgi:hypothetical protein
MMPRTLSSASRLLDCSQLTPTTDGDSCTALFEQLHSATRPHRDGQYQRAELNQLRQRPNSRVHRSLHGSDGLIPGSQRLESGCCGHPGSNRPAPYANGDDTPRLLSAGRTSMNQICLSAIFRSPERPLRQGSMLGFSHDRAVAAGSSNALNCSLLIGASGRSERFADRVAECPQASLITSDSASSAN